MFHNFPILNFSGNAEEIIQASRKGTVGTTPPMLQFHLVEGEIPGHPVIIEVSARMGAMWISTAVSSTDVM